MQWFSGLNAVAQTFLATIFTWGLTALGAAMTFFVRELTGRACASMRGFAAGVMIGAAFWSLLAPAIVMSGRSGGITWVQAVIGFLAGGAFLLVVDKTLPHLHVGLPPESAEGFQTTWKKSVLRVLSTAVHNVPEGIALGAVFGAAAGGMPGVSLGGAVALTVGIGLQNIPEGTCVSVPLRRGGMRSRRAFWYGQMSGAVEPAVAVIVALFVLVVPSLLAYALPFAAGAMVFVVIEEVLPDARLDRHTDLTATTALIGFSVMMILALVLR